MKLALIANVFDRPSYALPELVPENCYGEQTPLGIVLFPRPPLTTRSTPGDGPMRGVFRKKGVFAGSTFSVSGTSLYRGVTLVGTIDGASMVRWAYSDTQLVIVDPGSGKAWWYNGSVLARITDPDLPQVIDCKIVAARAYFAQKDSDRLIFSAIADVTDVDGLAFFTAESGPDRNVALEVIGNQLVVFGQETTEFWSAAGDADAPLVFANKMDVGCLAQASVQIADGKLYWISHQRSIVENGVRVSTPSIDEHLRLAGDGIDDATAFPVKHDGHWFYVVNIPGQGSYAFGIEGRGWVKWSSHGRDTFRANCGAMSEGEPYLGDAEDGVIWKFGTAQQLDGSDRITHRYAAFLEHDGMPQRVPPITVKAVMGQGAHTDPEVELRLSRNRGRTFDDWQSQSLGQQGEYDLKATFHRLGMIDSNGLVVEVRHSENIISAMMGLEIGPRP